MRKLLDVMPISVTVMLLAFVLVPAWAAVFYDAPWALAQAGDTRRAVTVGFAYWIGPIVLCLTILKRSFLFLPLFLLEVLGLVFETITTAHAHSPAVNAVRFGLIAAMGFGGVAVSRRDVLFPFLSRHSRLWRQAKRINTNTRLKLRLPGGERHAPAVLEDISLSGMALTCSRRDFDTALTGLRTGGELSVEVKVGTEALAIPCLMAWQSDVGELRRIGLKATDLQMMQRFLTDVTASGGASVLDKAAALSLNTSIRRVAIACWALVLAGAFTAPACSRAPLTPPAPAAKITHPLP